MPEPKYTPDGIPIITRPTYESTVSSMGRDQKLDKSFAKEVARRIKKGKPTYY